MSRDGYGSFFGRHEFLIRRLHSLTGLFPVGGYLVFHLATNAAILDGADAYQARVSQINALGPSTLVVLEWTFIFLPILFHAIIGLLIVLRGKRNIVNYPYEDNVRYTLQRVTGVIAFLFVFWHVFQMHGGFRNEWWLDTVIRPLGGGKFRSANGPASVAAAIQGHPLVIAFYLIGVPACVYHLANGLWSMGITWGVWTSPKAQRAAKVPCAAFGAILAIIGVGALLGFVRFPVSSTAPPPRVERHAAEPRPIDAPRTDISAAELVSGGADPAARRELPRTKDHDR
jgi:succinate dehydrogenase / fumarate reductase cytochrome b subunit